MGLEPGFSDGQTPLDEDERDGLLIPAISTRGELDEFEQLGVEKAIEWTMRKRFGSDVILTEEFVRELHRNMFGEIWRWAGEFRMTNKNLGVEKNEIPTELRKLIDDCRYWVAHSVFPKDEIAVRFSHRLVTIHPFANGNGRHARLIADVLVSDGLGRPPFSWGRATLTAPGGTRSAYLNALRKADKNNYALLIAFARQ
jgi:Fic-DOC domain mobile mystery protein B